jgi:serine/threonine-protein kinase
MLVGQKFGPFQIDKELGSGAMGTVYRATYEKTGQRVALKVMIAGLGTSETAQARFEREGEILKQLNHPNIVKLFGVGRSHGTRYYAMEYIQGEPMDKILQRRGQLPWQEVAAIARQICAALQHAHEQGIIHRDLKPSNLMMLPDGTVKLTDFGIAKDLDVTQITAANCTVGTAAYMSPEQCRGDKDMNFKSDLYSLGIVLYEFLTGRKPFQAEAAMDMFLQHIKGKFERPSRLVMDTPVWLDTLVCQLLEKKPEQRPRDAAAVSEALERITEKVTAQVSAGVDLVTSRAVDRSAGKRVALEDRETARVLQTAATGRKSRRKRIPLSQRGWVIALGVVAILGILAGLLYMAFRPPSAESLYAQAERLMRSDNPEDWDKAIDRDGPIPEYMRHYGRNEDERTRQVRDWSNMARAALKERQLANRMRTGMDPQDDAERAAQNGVRYESSGNLVAARKSWEALLQQRDDPEVDGPAWAIVAEKHLRDLNALDERVEKWRGQVIQARQGRKNYTGSDERESAALKALHFELFGDEQGAREMWAKARLPAKDTKADERLWSLLSAATTYHARNATTLSKEQRIEIIRNQLTAAEKNEEEQPLDARATYWDVVQLYGDSKDFDEVVQQARKHLRADERR